MSEQETLFNYFPVQKLTTVVTYVPMIPVCLTPNRPEIAILSKC
jgi:hypothetical protein